MSAYEPTTYWQNQPPIPRKPGHAAQEVALDRVLRRVNGVRSILEIGCGSGRVAALLTRHWPNAKYTGVDLNPDRLDETRAAIGKGTLLAADFLDIDPGDIEAFAAKFDLVVASEVLMHIQPAKVGRAIEQLTSWSKGLVLTIDWTEPIDRPAKPHNFRHEYERFGLTPAERVGVQTIFLTQVAR